jgi:hypothetical protein
MGQQIGCTGLSIWEAYEHELRYHKTPLKKQTYQINIELVYIVVHLFASTGLDVLSTNSRDGCFGG